MRNPALQRWLPAALLLCCSHALHAADDVTLLRVFLTDGTVLTSYGEPARIGDRVVFSMPTAATPDPPLHLMDLAASQVDWERTNGYADAARAARYVETQAELDYAALSTRMTQALNELMQTTDAGRRLAIAENARRMLAAWPREHFNYRLEEVRQMLSLLDEAIADLRAAAGEAQFDLSLTAFTEPPPAVPLAPPPDAKETLEQVLAAARVVGRPADRTALLATALAGLDRDAALLPSAWLDTARTAVRAELEAERRTDRAYQSLTTRIMTLANRYAEAADVRSLAGLTERVRENDRTLGGRRPDTVDALVAAVEARLDAARRLRLARDRWALRVPDYRRYERAMETALDLFTAVRPSLEDIRLLAGSSPQALEALEHAVGRVINHTRAVAPPEELRAAHALLVSAAQLAANAARIRHEATLVGSIARAWDASSAAAGALMLADRARTDMQDVLRPPRLR